MRYILEHSSSKVSSHSAGQEIQNVLHNRAIHYCVTNNPLFILYISQINPIDTSDSLSLRYILILSRLEVVA
jgi:hypothetical protein